MIFFTQTELHTIYKYIFFILDLFQQERHDICLSRFEEECQKQKIWQIMERFEGKKCEKSRRRRRRVVVAGF